VKNGLDFDPKTGKKYSTNAIMYGWFIWDKNYKGYPKVEWL
jgi:hypothetical protein